MILGISGHRDRYADPNEVLEYLRRQSPSLVVHGGARGFDSLVGTLAQSLGIVTQVVRPDYQRHEPRVAPLIRNDLIVEQATALLVLYDGRPRGGTLYTINAARRKKIPIHYVGVLR